MECKCSHLFINNQTFRAFFCKKEVRFSESYPSLSCFFGILADFPALSKQLADNKHIKPFFQKFLPRLPYKKNPAYFPLLFFLVFLRCLFFSIFVCPIYLPLKKIDTTYLPALKSLSFFPVSLSENTIQRPTHIDFCNFFQKFYAILSVKSAIFAEITFSFSKISCNNRKLWKIYRLSNNDLKSSETIRV